MRKKWEVAMRRKGFHASNSSVLCSQHFQQGDFDRTGQTVRLQNNVIPSVFSFSVHPKRVRVSSQAFIHVNITLSITEQGKIPIPLYKFLYVLCFFLLVGKGQDYFYLQKSCRKPVRGL